MTTIAWDGKTLAADKLACAGNGKFRTTKIFRVEGCLVGATGSSSLCMEMVEWFRAGAKPEAFPALQRDPDKNCGMLVIRPDGRSEKYEAGPVPFPYHDEQIAIGSGGDFARAAMYLGQTADEAVKTAALFDCNTNDDIDVLRLE